MSKEFTPSKTQQCDVYNSKNKDFTSIWKFLQKVEEVVQWQDH